MLLEISLFENKLELKLLLRLLIFIVLSIIEFSIISPAGFFDETSNIFCKYSIFSVFKAIFNS